MMPNHGRRKGFGDFRELCSEVNCFEEKTRVLYCMRFEARSAIVMAHSESGSTSIPCVGFPELWIVTGVGDIDKPQAMNKVWEIADESAHAREERCRNVYE